MPTDCKKLSPNARKIFEKLIPYFGRDPWNKPRWRKCGKVHDNGWYDLRKAKDRILLEEKNQKFIGSVIYTMARTHHDKHGSLKGFKKTHLGKLIQHQAELLILLNDLSFQIDTYDLIDSLV